MQDNNIQDEKKQVQIKNKFILNKEKIIIAGLAFVFIIISLGAFWDMYLKNHVCFGDCVHRSEISNQQGQNISSQPTNTTDNSKQPKQQKQDTSTSTDTMKQPKQDNAVVDSKLYASCTAKISDEKVYKTCCDSLTADDSVKKACKKVVDDKVQLSQTQILTQTPKP